MNWFQKTWRKLWNKEQATVAPVEIPESLLAPAVPQDRFFTPKQWKRKRTREKMARRSRRINRMRA